jgi:hypothetical protein
MISMIVASPEWATWVRVALLAPLVCCVDLLVCGFCPKNTRQWQTFGIVMACFTVFCVVMICVFHSV